VPQGLTGSGYVGVKRRYDPRPLRCQCEQPWDDGEENCAHCGKRLPERILVDLSRKERAG